MLASWGFGCGALGDDAFAATGSWRRVRAEPGRIPACGAAVAPALVSGPALYDAFRSSARYCGLGIKIRIGGAFVPGGCAPQSPSGSGALARGILWEQRAGRNSLFALGVDEARA